MLDYTGQASNDIAIADFLYFIPMISPEPLTVSGSPVNTLHTRILSIRQEAKSERFSVILDFDVSGQGFLNYAIDPSGIVRRRKRSIADGKSWLKQLDYIRYEGPGKGHLEIHGHVQDGEKVVMLVRLQFDDRGASPVTIGLKDVRLVDGALKYENKLVARVSALEFTRASRPPRMGVRVASVRRQSAGRNFFQNFKGRVVGLVANLLLNPIPITKTGNDTMLNFGQAPAAREGALNHAHRAGSGLLFLPALFLL